MSVNAEIKMKATCSNAETTVISQIEISGEMADLIGLVVKAMEKSEPLRMIFYTAAVYSVVDGHENDVEGIMQKLRSVVVRYVQHKAKEKEGKKHD